MEIFALGAILIVTALVIYVNIQGLDLKKPLNWLYGVLGFFGCFTMVLFLRGDLIEAMEIGAIFAFSILISGAIRRRNKQKYNGSMAGSLLQQYGKEDHPSLFARLVNKFLGKYK